MDTILNAGIQIIIWLQNLGEWLTPIMKLFTFLGNEQFYLLVAPAILWCLDASLGLRLGIFLMINGMINSALKVAFHSPRPYWYTSNVKALGSAENSFGVPSGHAQNSVVVWGALANKIKRRWAWIVAIFLMFFIGISRLYLAVHFPHDVLIGWIAGAIMLWVLLRLEQPVLRWFNNFNLAVRLSLLFLFSLALISIILLAQLALRGWGLPVEWVNNAHLAFPSEAEITPLSYHNYLSSPGAFFGMAAGWLWTVKSGGFNSRGIWWKLVLRYLLGLAGVLLLYLVPSMLFTDAETFISYAIRYIRYAVIGFWIAGLAPWLFVKLKLASRVR